MKKKLLYILFMMPFLIVLLITIYIYGIKEYGSPTNFRQEQEARIQAIEDSLSALESVEPSVNIADSTLFGMSVYQKIIEDARGQEGRLRALQTTIDSLKNILSEIEQREKTVDEKQLELIESRKLLQDENAAKLALLYDNMKTAQAVPLFLEMNDTLAVKIIMNMQERNSARLLGAIVEKDVSKAARINKLLSMEEVAN
ncbi:hypothetical protein ACFL6H_04095 [Candidatus Latescibacterota bacterium]